MHVAVAVGAVSSAGLLIDDGAAHLCWSVGRPCLRTWSVRSVLLLLTATAGWLHAGDLIDIAAMWLRPDAPAERIIHVVERFRVTRPARSLVWRYRNTARSAGPDGQLATARLWRLPFSSPLAPERVEYLIYFGASAHTCGRRYRARPLDQMPSRRRRRAVSAGFDDIGALVSSASRRGF